MEFRQALSSAVDRQALIDAVFVGQGAPAQPSMREGDPLYNEQLAKQWIEYDPDKANAMLDALIPNKDGEGYRTDKEGRRVSIIFELDQTRTTFLDMFELAIPMFQAVGIDAQMRTMDRSLWKSAYAVVANTMRRRTSSAPTPASPPCSIRASTCRSTITASTPRPGRSTTPSPRIRRRKSPRQQ